MASLLTGCNDYILFPNEAGKLNSCRRLIDNNEQQNSHLKYIFLKAFLDSKCNCHWPHPATFTTNAGILNRAQITMEPNLQCVRRNRLHRIGLFRSLSEARDPICITGQLQRAECCDVTWRISGISVVRPVHSVNRSLSDAGVFSFHPNP